MIETLSKVLPQLAIIAAVAGIIGWSLRGLTIKPPAPVKPSKGNSASDKSQPDRAKNLEASLEKSKAAHKSLKAELEKLQATSISKEAHDSITAELEAAHKKLETETKRISAFETDLKKSQQTIKNLNARANDADKLQKDRSFALENELSTAREQLAILQNRPDDSVSLTTEIERLRESVAVSTRYAGEMRKREAAALEALEKAEAKLADLSDPSRPVVTSKKIGPVSDSGRIAAAKAEVIRLVEMNKQKEAEKSAAIEEEVPVAIEEVAAVIEEAPEVIDEEVVAAVIEETPAVVEEAPPVKKAPAPTELFALD